MLKSLNLSDRAVNLLRVDNTIYQKSPNILHITLSLTSILPLSVWHKRLRHTNFSSLKTFLHYFNISFRNNSNDYICNSCQWTKATKIYNQGSQKHAQRFYQLVHTNLVSFIKPIGFAEERYFFTFINNYIRIIDTYTVSKKSN